MNKNNFMKAMSMIDEELLHEADTPYTSEAAEDTSNDVYRENETPDSVSGVDVYHGFSWKKFLAVAATFVIAAGAVGGGAYYYSQLKGNNNNNINNNSMVEEDTEYSTVTQTSTETQTTTSEHIIVTQTFADTETTVQDTSPLSNIVRCEPIKASDDLKSFMAAGRTANGFGCITYNYLKHQATYLRISEDMQTVDVSLLTPPSNQSRCNISYLCFAFEKDGIWAIAYKESYGRESREAGEQQQYLLCHYAEDGTLLSAIPTNDLFAYQLGESFNSVGDVLYMTLSDSSVLQIDKETAEASVVTDLRKDDTYYNKKLLCFDRDDKPVLLQENVGYAPDKHTINEAVVSEFDLESGSCGQTIYTAGENWGRTKISVLKGCGEYRLFINTYSELIGIKDDGTQEVLIDIKASDLETQIMNTDDSPVPYTNNLFDINIIPADDKHFTVFYEHYPESRTEAFRLTRKHESELN